MQIVSKQLYSIKQQYSVKIYFSLNLVGLQHYFHTIKV